MSELSKSDGDPIDPAREAVAWQVRRVVGRGRPQLVHADGIPLLLPITAEIAELRRAVQAGGAYLLHPVDEHRRRIDGAPGTYVRLEPSPAWSKALVDVPAAATAGASLDALAALAQASHALAKQIVSGVPVLLDTAQAVLRVGEDADTAITAFRGLMK